MGLEPLVRALFVLTQSAANSVNGVARIHTDLLKQTVMHDFAELWPEKFCNVTNGADGGLEIAVTGSGRTRVAIQRMVPAWAQTMNGHRGWTAKTTPLPDGELLTVTATDPKEIEHIRGLGFIGLLVSGSMHQPHHLPMAKGEFDHEQLGQGR